MFLRQHINLFDIWYIKVDIVEYITFKVCHSFLQYHISSMFSYFSLGLTLNCFLIVMSFLVLNDANPIDHSCSFSNGNTILTIKYNFKLEFSIYIMKIFYQYVYWLLGYSDKQNHQSNGNGPNLSLGGTSSEARTGGTK